MKKLLLSIMSVAVCAAAYAQGTDDFATLKAHTNYANDTTAQGWITANSAVLSGGDKDSNPVFSAIGPDDQTKAVCINGKTTAVGSITSPILSNGIHDLSLNYGYFFSESKGVNFTIDILQNGAVVRSYDVADTDAAKGSVYSYSTTVGLEGDFQISIINNSPSQSTSNKDRYAIWNIKWTAGDGSGEQPVEDDVQSPVITPATGTYTEPQTVTITAGEGCAIYYTLDGSAPNDASILYEAPFEVSQTTTVKAVAYNDEDVASKPVTSVITIVKSIANTLETAYTTAEAIALIDDPSSNLKDSVYVKGVVSNVDSYSSTYHNLTYWLDGKSFEIYAGFGLDGIDPENESYLGVGDEVIVKGLIKKYNSTYEMDKNNYIVSLRKASEPAVSIRNTPETAYTVARAFELVDAGQDLDTKVYVKGIISTIDEVDTGSYGNATYHISDDGTVQNQFEVYRGYSVGGNKFSSQDEIKVGDVVVVYGKLTKFYEVYEFASGNYIYSLNGSTSAIKVVKAEPETPAIDPLSDAVYNICGQRVYDIRKKGIYIVNGKKHIVR